MYLISVYFDSSTNKKLQHYIDRIAEISGNDFMISHKVPPHMTISAIEARSAEVILPYFEKLQQTLTQGEIQIMSIGQLLPYVFYAAPVLSEYLSNLMQQVYDGVKGIANTTISKYYRPHSWMPHITLGKTLEKEQMLRALEAMQTHFSPMRACVKEIGLAKVNPHEDVARYTMR
ncbi:MAG: 2'-5' RNA ligase family protein [Eubacterium sp.]|nr:2'-5' RNA ligase family protein [Eubacterium sp.]